MIFVKAELAPIENPALAELRCTLERGQQPFVHGAINDQMNSVCRPAVGYSMRQAEVEIPVFAFSMYDQFTVQEVYDWVGDDWDVTAVLFFVVR